MYIAVQSSEGSSQRTTCRVNNPVPFSLYLTHFFSVEQPGVVGRGFGCISKGCVPRSAPEAICSLRLVAADNAVWPGKPTAATSSGRGLSYGTHNQSLLILAAGGFYALSSLLRPLRGDACCDGGRACQRSRLIRFTCFFRSLASGYWHERSSLLRFFSETAACCVREAVDALLPPVFVLALFDSALWMWRACA